MGQNIIDMQTIANGQYVVHSPQFYMGYNRVSSPGLSLSTAPITDQTPLRAPWSELPMEPVLP